MQSGRISLMLPDAPGHSYGMGKFGSEFLLEDHDYTVTVPVAETANFPDPDPDLNAVIDLGYSIRPLREKARHVIDLPFPNYWGGDTRALLRLRVLKRGNQGPFFGEGSATNPSELPLLYAFSYAFDPANPPVLSGGQTGPEAILLAAGQLSQSSPDDLDSLEVQQLAQRIRIPNSGLRKAVCGSSARRQSPHISSVAGSKTAHGLYIV